MSSEPKENQAQQTQTTRFIWERNPPHNLRSGSESAMKAIGKLNFDIGRLERKENIPCRFVGQNWLPEKGDLEDDEDEVDAGGDP